jgi:predicted RNA-binding Zn-ribbon protein involved in translation (DUF1610 family)
MIQENVLVEMHGGVFATFSCFDCGKEVDRFVSEGDNSRAASVYFICEGCGFSYENANHERDSHFKHNGKYDVPDATLHQCTVLRCRHNEECNGVEGGVTVSAKPYFCKNLQKG